jgi:predicted ribosome quality control (RQC) complex YloA/Tae2 family protein
VDAFLLAHLARELAEEWAGAWVQQAWQDLSGRVVLRLYRSHPSAETAFLLLSPLPEAQGLGILSERPAVPPRPPALAAYLRAHLVGGRLETSDCPPVDRVVDLGFRTREGTLRVVLEATGRRGNLAVIDAGGCVRAAWRWESAETHPARPLAPGGPYAPPPVRSRPAPAGAASSGPGSLRDAGRWLAETAAKETVEAETVDREARLRRLRRRLEVRAEKIRADLARLADPVDLRRQADALAAGLAGVRKGDAEARVPDPFDPEATLTIALDAARGPGENLNRLYDRARKAERARQILEARLGATLEELEVGPGGGAPSGEGLETAACGVGEGPYRRFRASNGWPLWVGRNGKENERLLREARAWDLWFHARESPGAHVLLRLPGKEARVPEAVAVEAAGLAAFYSRRSGEDWVDVMVIEAGRVRKPKGGSPGQVLVSGERTVRVRPRTGSDGTPAGDRRGRKG